MLDKPEEVDTIEEDEDDALKEYLKNRTTKRRESVSAESYDPSKDLNMSEIETFPKTDDQLQKIKEAVKEAFLFRSLDENQLKKVIDAMYVRPVEEGEVVIRQGDKGDYFYAIESGRYDVYISKDGKEPQLTNTCENRGSFGELAMLYNVPRAATIKARTAGVLWVLNRNVFQRLVLKSVYEKRCRFETLIRNVSVLAPLNSYEISNVCDAITPVAYSAGEIIIREGDEGDGMYFIEEGEVAVTRREDSKEMEKARLRSGDQFGEMALVNKAPRSANVCAATDVKLAFLDIEAFERLLGPCINYIKENIKCYADKKVEEQLKFKA